MIKKLILPIIIILGLSNISIAQEDSTKNDVYGYFITFPIEFPIIDIGQVNSELPQLGYPKCDYPAANIGIGLQLYTNRWITTLSFNKTTKRENTDDYLTEFEYRSTSFNVGYDLTKNHRYSIYPFVGFKGYGLNYLYREQAQKDISFGEYFQSDLQYKEANYSTGNLDLGVGASFQWFFLVNFRAGYLLSFKQSDWDVNYSQNNLSNSPSPNCKYYFNLTIGLGMIASDKEVRRHFERHQEEMEQ